MPSGQWSMIWSSPGYFASYSRISAMQSAGEPTIQAFCATPSRIVGARAGAPGRAPRPALVVRVADEAERREPLVALVVSGLDAPDGLLLRLRHVEAEAEAEILAELLRRPWRAHASRYAWKVWSVMRSPFERDHALQVVLRQEVDRLPAGDRLPDLDRPVDRAGTSVTSVRS